MADTVTVTTKNQLKQWFVTSAKPTQAQYYAWLDAYWHRSDLIPQARIEGLGNALANKADADQLQYYAKTDATNIDAVKWRNVLGVGEVDLSNYYNKGEINGMLYSVYKTKGSVANYAALPSSGNVYGDVWNLIDTGDNYVWVENLNNTGSAGWDNVSGVVDLTTYHTITQYQAWVIGRGYATTSAVALKLDKPTTAIVTADTTYNRLAILDSNGNTKYFNGTGTGERVLTFSATGQPKLDYVVVDQITEDTDIITAITGATYTGGMAMISPANGKVFEKGLIYFDSVNGYIYYAFLNNNVMRFKSA
ncbi:MAG: hypothetical protein E2590_12885 [Chryseobacterium sp.]|nr:hypothetical protein [Chryseobacterium sp.]